MLNQEEGTRTSASINEFSPSIFEYLAYNTSGSKLKLREKSRALLLFVARLSGSLDIASWRDTNGARPTTIAHHPFLQNLGSRNWRYQSSANRVPGNAGPPDLVLECRRSL
jgi:hypothetical protein